MIVLIEMLIRRYKKSMREWEQEGNDWVNEAKDNDYYHRYFSDWHRNHPSPKEVFVTKLKVAGAILGGLLVAGFSVAIIHNAGIKDREQQTQAYAGHSCKAHELNDRVKIEYGTYAGATGVIVGGCNHDEDYQVKLDKQMYNVDNDGNNDPVDVGGKIIGVDTYRNLIKIEK